VPIQIYILSLDLISYQLYIFGPKAQSVSCVVIRIPSSRSVHNTGALVFCTRRESMRAKHSLISYALIYDHFYLPQGNHQFVEAWGRLEQQQPYIKVLLYQM
jgi:hypothetical protein